MREEIIQITKMDCDDFGMAGFGEIRLVDAGNNVLGYARTDRGLKRLLTKQEKWPGWTTLEVVPPK